MLFSAVNQINASISRREELFLCHEGSIPFIKTRIINPLFNRFQMSPGNFYTTDACIGCKRCEKSCPVGNIIDDGQKACLGDGLHLMPGMLSCLSAACGAIWKKDER